VVGDGEEGGADLPSVIFPRLAHDRVEQIQSLAKKAFRSIPKYPSLFRWLANRVQLQQGSVGPSFFIPPPEIEVLNYVQSRFRGYGCCGGTSGAPTR
jgi:hypothetical protein